MLRFRSSEASQLCSRCQRSECAEQNYPLPASDWAEPRCQVPRRWTAWHESTECGRCFCGSADLVTTPSSSPRPPAHEWSLPASRPPSFRELIGLNRREHLRKSQIREDLCSFSDLSYSTDSSSLSSSLWKTKKIGLSCPSFFFPLF